MLPTVADQHTPSGGPRKCCQLYSSWVYLLPVVIFIGVFVFTTNQGWGPDVNLERGSCLPSSEASLVSFASILTLGEAAYSS